MGNSNNLNDDDYNPREAIRTVEDTLYQPDKFAEVFVNATKKSKIIDAALKEVIESMIASDSVMKDKIKDLIREVEKENWRFYVSKIWFAVWTAFVIIVTALVRSP